MDIENLSPVTTSYKLVVVINKDLDFEVEHLSKEKAEKLHGEFMEKFGKDSVNAFIRKGYLKMEETSTAL